MATTVRVPSVKSTSGKSNKSYPFYLGGIATAMAGTFTHPLDLTRVRMQTMDPKPSMAGAITHCIRVSGFTGLFEGLSATWYRGMSYSLVRFWSYDIAKTYLAGRNPSNEFSNAVTAGIFAGVVGGVVANPGDIVLIRMQSESTKLPNEKYGYRNVIQGLYKMVRVQGLAESMQGVQVTIIRAILVNVGQLSSYDLAKQRLLKYNFSDTISTHFLASFVAGTVGTAMSQPADVVRSRIMAAGESSTRLGGIGTVRELFRTSGLSWAFRGFLPAWTRVTPQTILTFVILEKLKEFVDYQKSQFK